MRKMSTLHPEWLIQMKEQAVAQNQYNTLLKHLRLLQNLSVLFFFKKGEKKTKQKPSSLESGTKSPRIIAFPHHSHSKTILWKCFLFNKSIYLLVSLGPCDKAGVPCSLWYQVQILCLLSRSSLISEFASTLPVSHPQVRQAPLLGYTLYKHTCTWCLWFLTGTLYYHSSCSVFYGFFFF